MYKLAGFDFDGTLADSASWFYETMDQLADEFGFKRVRPEERAYLRGLDSRGIMKHLGISMRQLPGIAARMRSRGAADQHRFELFPRVTELFRELRELGIAVAIVSSNSEAVIREKLGSECAAQVIHFGCGSSLFGKARKLKGLLRATGRSAEEALYIGDEIRDAEAARQVGMAFGAVAWGYTAREALEKQKPRFIFESFEEIIVELRAPSGR